MLKSGVVEMSQLVSGKDKSWFGAQRKVSALLLQELERVDNRSELFERIMLELVDDRGAYKRTSRDRFDLFDEEVVSRIAARWGAKVGTIRIHDTAVSSGQTAVDFFRRCNAEFRDIEYLATDYDPYLTVLRSGGLTVLLSSRGEVVQVINPPFVFTLHRQESRLLYPVNNILRNRLMTSSVPKIIRRYLEGDLDGIEVGQLCLFCPDAVEMAETRSGFSLGQHNLLQPHDVNGIFHCVRAMNVLNPTYFSPAEFQVIFRNLWTMLCDGGLLVAGSNQESGSKVLGGVYQKTSIGFERMWESYRNDCIEDVLQGFRAPGG